MKKIVFISIIVLLTLSSCGARRAGLSGGSSSSGGTLGSIKGKCVVLDFQASTNVTADELEAIAYNFRTGFYPSHYRMLEVARVKQTVQALGYDQTRMTREQLCEVGRRLEANLVVVGTVNKLMDEYSLDVQAIDVAKGTTAASQGGTFQKSNYRDGSKLIAQRLAGKL